MEKDIKEISYKDKNINMDSIFGSMETDIKVTLQKIKDKDQDSIIGMMEVGIKDNGKLIE